VYAEEMLELEVVPERSLGCEQWEFILGKAFHNFTFIICVLMYLCWRRNYTVAFTEYVIERNKKLLLSSSLPKWVWRH